MRESSLGLAATAIVMTMLLAGCAVAPPAHFTRSSDTLTPCVSAPRCVSSQAPADGDKYVAPLRFSGETATARRALLDALAADGAHIVRADGRFIHATYTTTLGFVDDVTFIVQPDAHMIDVKSSARIGYYDFGVNRKRVARLRSAFEAALSETSATESE